MKISERVHEYDRRIGWEGDPTKPVYPWDRFGNEPVYGRWTCWTNPFWAALWGIRVAQRSAPERALRKTMAKLPPAFWFWPPNIRILLWTARVALLSAVTHGMNYQDRLNLEKWIGLLVRDELVPLLDKFMDGCECVEGAHYANVVLQNLNLACRALDTASTKTLKDAPAFTRLSLYVQAATRPGVNLWPIGDAWPGEASAMPDRIADTGEPVGSLALAAEHPNLASSLGVCAKGKWKVYALRKGSSHWLHGHEDGGSLLVSFGGEPVLIDAGVPSFGARLWTPAKWRRWKQWEMHNTREAWGRREVPVSVQVNGDEVLQQSPGVVRRTRLWWDRLEILVECRPDEMWHYLVPMDSGFDYRFDCVNSKSSVLIAEGYGQTGPAWRYRVVGPHDLSITKVIV